MAALLVLAVAPLLSVVPSELAAGVVAAADVLAVVDVDVVAEALLADEEAAVVAVVLFVVAADPPEAEGSNPSWLRAEKMLSMNPIMPPPLP